MLSSEIKSLHIYILIRVSFVLAVMEGCGFTILGGTSPQDKSMYEIFHVPARGFWCSLAYSQTKAQPLRWFIGIKQKHLLQLEKSCSPLCCNHSVFGGWACLVSPIVNENKVS